MTPESPAAAPAPQAAAIRPRRRGAAWLRPARLSGAALACAGASLLCAAPAWASPIPLITQFAGNGTTGHPTPGPATSSPLFYPQATALDSQGDLYIADAGNCDIEKVTPSGTLSLFAGDNVCAAPTPGPATSSAMYYPQGVAVDSHDNVYVADTLNNTIDKITPSGTLSIFAGNGTQGHVVPGAATSSPLGSPMGVAVGPDDNVYIADTLNYTVDRVTPGGTISVIAGTGTHGSASDGPALSEQLNDPEYVGTDPAGDVLVGDTGGNKVEKISGGQLTVVAGNGTNGPPVLGGQATASPLGYPEGVTGDAAGDIFIADTNNGYVEEVAPNGVLTAVAGTGVNAAPTYGGPITASALDAPFNLTLAPSGTVFVTDINNQTIDRIGAATPGAPGQPALTPGDGQADLSFTEPADPGTSAVTGYEVSLDGGASWQSLSTTAGAGNTLNATLPSLTNGTNYTVLIRADNSAGAGAESRPGTVTPGVQSTTTSTSTTTTSPVLTTATTATTATTTATTPTATTSDEGVSVSPTVAAQGITVHTDATLRLPLVCPQTASGCDADGLLTIGTSGRVPHLASDGVRSTAVIARFAGIQIEAGHSRLVAVSLTPAAQRQLQRQGIRRVRVTLTVHNHLDGGPVVTTAQELWLNIAPLVDACPAASGRLSATGLGEVRLGLTRGAAHRLGRHRTVGYGYERYCLAGGSIRVAYPARRLLSSLPPATRRAVAGRVIVALTFNRRYEIDGVHTRTTVAAARQRITLGHGIVVGKNTWYLVHAGRAEWVIKAQHGVVRELGITDASLTRTAAQRRALVRNL